MLPGLNPAKMQAMMKQMGIKQEEIEAARVIIEKEDGKIIIEEPNVLKVNMQGNESFQITGEIREEEVEEGIKEEDVKLVVEKTGRSEEKVRESLGKTNDIAESIMELS